MPKANQCEGVSLLGAIRPRDMFYEVSRIVRFNFADFENVTYPERLSRAEGIAYEYWQKKGDFRKDWIFSENPGDYVREVMDVYTPRPEEDSKLVEGLS